MPAVPEHALQPAKQLVPTVGGAVQTVKDVHVVQPKAHGVQADESLKYPSLQVVQPAKVLAVQLAQPVTQALTKQVSASLHIPQSVLHATHLFSLFKKNPFWHYAQKPKPEHLKQFGRLTGQTLQYPASNSASIAKYFPGMQESHFLSVTSKLVLT